MIVLSAIGESVFLGGVGHGGIVLVFNEKGIFIGKRTHVIDSIVLLL